MFLGNVHFEDREKDGGMISKMVRRKANSKAERCLGLAQDPAPWRALVLAAYNRRIFYYDVTFHLYVSNNCRPVFHFEHYYYVVVNSSRLRDVMC
jgi:hypothetical protein